jgi:hypothetical protein
MAKQIDKSMVSHAIVSKINKDRNPIEIRASHLDEYKNPGKISIYSRQEFFVPDIEAIYEKENVVYEIELDEKLKVTKWLAFSKYVRKSNGSFYLVVPMQFKESFRKILENNAVNAGLITFDTSG